jgi:hypothetical protein
MRFAILLAAAALVLLAGCINTQPQACTADAKICPDGSAVGRVPPSCEFASCPAPQKGELGGFCGGIAAFQCNAGLTCAFDGAFPDAGGICVRADCPIYTPPMPGWCANGTVIAGEIVNGCRGPPKCA